MGIIVSFLIPTIAIRPSLHSSVGIVAWGSVSDGLSVGVEGRVACGVFVQAAMFN